MIKSMAPVRRKLDVTDMGLALGWLDEGVSQLEAASRLDVSHSVIRRLLERVESTGRVDNRPHSGRPRATTTRQDRLLIWGALRGRRHGQFVERATVCSISDQTVHNHLHESGMAS